MPVTPNFLERLLDSEIAGLELETSRTRYPRLP